MSDAAPFSQRDVEALRTTIDKLDRTVEKFREGVESTYARKDVVEPAIAGLRRDLDRHSDWFTWAGRLVVGAVILALLGLVIAGG